MLRQPVLDIVLAASLTLLAAACASPDGEQSLQDGYAAPYDGGTVTGATLYGALPDLSEEDRDALGRIAFAEAGNQGEMGIAAVIYTIFNRVNSGQFQSCVQDVIDAPKQFEPSMRAGGWRNLRPLSAAQSDTFDSILNQILTGELPDPTNGALFFQNARIVAARAARGKGSWSLVDFGGTEPVAEIGDHRFYDWRAAINLAAARQRPVIDYSEPSYPSSELAEYTPPTYSYSPPAYSPPAETPADTYVSAPEAETPAGDVAAVETAPAEIAYDASATPEDASSVTQDGGEAQDASTDQEEWGEAGYVVSASNSSGSLY